MKDDKDINVAAKYYLAPFCVVLLCVLLILPSDLIKAQEGPAYRAVIVGIEDYAEINDCLWADDDAAVLGNLLALQWDEKILLNAEATKANVKDSVEWLAAEAGANDISLFYFAGHGTNDGVNTYICPYDSLPAEVSRDIADYELAAWLNAINGQKIVIFDSCHSGGFVYRSVGNSGAPRVKEGTPMAELKGGFAEKLGYLAVESYEVMTACEVNELAWGYSELGHGVFTYFLLEGLSNTDLVGDGAVTTGELFNYAESRTIEWGYNQHPQWWDGISERDLEVLR